MCTVKTLPWIFLRITCFYAICLLISEFLGPSHEPKKTLMFIQLKILHDLAVTSRSQTVFDYYCFPRYFHELTPFILEL